MINKIVITIFFIASIGMATLITIRSTGNYHKHKSEGVWRKCYFKGLATYDFNNPGAVYYLEEWIDYKGVAIIGGWETMPEWILEKHPARPSKWQDITECSVFYSGDII